MRNKNVFAFSVTASEALLPSLFGQVYFNFCHNLKILCISATTFRVNPPFVFMLCLLLMLISLLFSTILFNLKPLRTRLFIMHEYAAHIIVFF